MVTRGVLLMRFVFHEPSSVLMSSLSSRSTPQTVVGLRLPSLVKVVSNRYFEFATSSKVSAKAQADFSSMVTFLFIPPRSFEKTLNVLPISP